jgi:hypothetical protein
LESSLTHQGTISPCSPQNDGRPNASHPRSNLYKTIKSEKIRSIRHVTTTINYYLDPGDGTPPTPVCIEGKTVINERPVVPTPVAIHDITGEEDKYTLHTHGFQLIRHESKEKTVDDEARLASAYYAECEELYKKMYAHLT